jgi:hypothetical protein
MVENGRPKMLMKSNRPITLGIPSPIRPHYARSAQARLASHQIAQWNDSETFHCEEIVVRGAGTHEQIVRTVIQKTYP